MCEGGAGRGATDKCPLSVEQMSRGVVDRD